MKIIPLFSAHSTVLCAAFSLILGVCLGCQPNSRPNSPSGTGHQGSSVEQSPKAIFAGKYPIRITTTVGMVADLVRAVGGDQVQVKQLLGSGVDPHLYKPTRDDVQTILSGDVVIYSGLMLEGKMAETLEGLGKRKPSMAVGAALQLPGDLAGDPHHPDPHVWMDVNLWSQGAQAIGDFLVRYDPPNAQAYTDRTVQLRERLARLHAYGQAVMEAIPESRRVLITSHDAFRYFGRAYGIEVQAIQGISTESEAGLQRINELVDLLVNRKIEAVFVESSVPKESIQALLEGARSRGQPVKIGGELYSDAMGNEGSYEGTYIGMMDHNLTVVARELGSTAVPESGFKGKR